jgi:hypothetical protein
MKNEQLKLIVNIRKFDQIQTMELIFSENKFELNRILHHIQVSSELMKSSFLYYLEIQGYEQSRKSSALNFNNNCYESDNSIQSMQSSSISSDSLCSFDNDTLEREQLLSNNHPESDKRTLANPSYLADVTDKLDSNIAIAQTLLNMLDSFNDNHDNHSSAVKIDMLHMYIRQFLIQFDRRVRLARKNISST